MHRVRRQPFLYSIMWNKTFIASSELDHKTQVNGSTLLLPSFCSKMAEVELSFHAGADAPAGR
jgi:hypothetical protein